ncbi:MAG TPA: hypothetical protein DC054_07865 [Blastocatellia bacterium]|nr:hypothetical protein [Blastocatellia bacterium]
MIAITFYITLRVESSGESLDESLLVAQFGPVGIADRSTQSRFIGIALGHSAEGKRDCDFTLGSTKRVSFLPYGRRSPDFSRGFASSRAKL